MIEILEGAAIWMKEISRPEIIAAFWASEIIMDFTEVRFQIKIPAGMVKKYGIPAIIAALEEG